MALGAAALIVCILGILVATHVLVAGVVLALAEYTLALWIGGGPPRLTGGVVLGVVLLLLVETADFGRRAHGAVIGPGVVLGQLRAWALLGSLAGESLCSRASRRAWRAGRSASVGSAVAAAGAASSSAWRSACRPFACPRAPDLQNAPCRRLGVSPPGDAGISPIGDRPLAP